LGEETGILGVRPGGARRQRQRKEKGKSDTRVFHGWSSAAKKSAEVDGSIPLSRRQEKDLGRREKPGRRRHPIHERQLRKSFMPAIGPDLLGRLYRQHAPALRLYARQWPDVADDVVQDAFISLARQSVSPESVLPWLYRTIRNAALSAQRAAARRRRREGVASSPEAWFAATEDRLAAAEAAGKLAEVPLEMREVIVARLWGGLKFEEVAALVGCSLATAHRRYQAGLAALRERLEGRCTPTT
jgi:RNA polymerase sigma-70 factor (ECF subfamily)